MVSALKSTQGMDQLGSLPIGRVATASSIHFDGNGQELGMHSGKGREARLTAKLVFAAQHCVRLGLDRSANFIRQIVVIGRLFGSGQERTEHSYRIQGCEVVRVRCRALNRDCDQEDPDPGSVVWLCLAHIHNPLIDS